MLTVYLHPLFYEHQTGPLHPEQPFRIEAALEGVRRGGAAGTVLQVEPDDRAAESIIDRVHSPAYRLRFARSVHQGEPLFESMDNPISARSFDAAKAAVGVSLAAVDRMQKTERSRVLVLARPPGHHAEKDQAMGFCFFNNVACAAEALLDRPGIERVLILDWDVHHGNGTQHLFEDRADVFYISTHRYPFYPGTGASSEIGSGTGRGFTRNFPFEAGAGDADYLRIFERQIIPLVEEYAPHAILISAGFDAHLRDPLGGMRLTESAFGAMTRRVCELADRFTGGRVFSILEGGYDPEGIAASVAEHVAALVE